MSPLTRVIGATAREQARPAATHGRARTARPGPGRSASGRRPEGPAGVPRRARASPLENVGRLAFALRPSALDEFGLVPALKDLCSTLEEHRGPKIDLDVTLPDDARLPARLETAIFRITQEALTNVVKHAEAKAVHIVLAGGKASVRLAIEDDGRGFSPAQEAGGGLGLVGMRERVASVNGALAVYSQRGAGTRLEVEIPLP